MTLFKNLFNRATRNYANAEDIFPTLKGQAERNAERIAEIKQQMGTKWIFADCNKKTRLKEPRPI